MDLNTQEVLGETNSCPMLSQAGARSRPEPSNLDYSKSQTQLLSSLGNLNKKPREGFGIVAACSDNWRHTMDSQHTSHEDRLLKLEHYVSVMNTAIQNTQSLNLGIQAEHRSIEAMVAQHKSIISRLSHEVENSSQKVNTVVSFVEQRMRKFEDRMTEIKQNARFL